MQETLGQDYLLEKGMTTHSSILAWRISWTEKLIFSSTTIGKHHFFSAQPSLWSSSHIRTRLLEKPSVQLLGRIQLFATPWTAARQASLFFTISKSLPKFLCTVLMMPPNHLILCHPLLFLPSIFPSIRVFCFFFFPMSQLFVPGSQNIGASASASVLPKHI